MMSNPFPPLPIYFPSIPSSSLLLQFLPVFVQKSGKPGIFRHASTNASSDPCFGTCLVWDCRVIHVTVLLHFFVCLTFMGFSALISNRSRNSGDAKCNQDNNKDGLHGNVF
eukprot:TRINITY_DN442_c0_g1_i1.p1 TRINITY_DN442_c0_g1~~TRINITY_DN442_c0_g1_i1.p1  ORF type:complete len:111 (-),score=8.80 TRINITY_DN442_c0_g1_i1:12-344(-)